MTTANNYEPMLPDQEPVDLARDSAAELSKLLAGRPEIRRAHVHLDDHDLVLPRYALELLQGILAQMAQGNAVTIIPTHKELTTQQAADLLNVSRPHLIKLLKDEQLPFIKVGTHRRIRFEDLMRYKAERDQRNHDATAELAAQAQELDMGY